MVAKLGTNWVAPESGSTAWEIAEALDRVPLEEGNVFDAMKNISRLPPKRQTNIELNGNPLQEYDLARIAKAY